MSTKPDPYSRSYWRFADEFPEVYADDHAYALWSRLRDMADMAWPSAASLPIGTRRRVLTVLVEAGLVISQPGDHYRIRGMDKQRGQRQEAARVGADARWRAKQSQSNGTANAVRPQSGRNATAMHIPSRAENSQDETREIQGSLPLKGLIQGAAASGVVDPG